MWNVLPGQGGAPRLAEFDFTDTDTEPVKKRGENSIASER